MTLPKYILLTRADELSAASPSAFSAIQRANRELRITYSNIPGMLAALQRDAVLIEAEAAYRVSLIETHSERLDACVREIIAGRKSWGDLARVNAEMAAAEEREERRAAA
jgi:hypothetical protein